MIPSSAIRRRWGRTRLEAPDDRDVVRPIAEFRSGDVPDMRHVVARGALARLRSEAATRRLGSPRLLMAGWGIAMALVVSGVPVGMVFLLRVLRIAPVWSFVALFSGVGLLVAVAGMIGSRLRGWLVADAVTMVVTALLRMGRCASCGYPLNAIPDEGDGMQECPECGAAWRAGRIGRVAVPAAPDRAAGLTRSHILLSALCRTRRRDDRGRPFDPVFVFPSTDEAIRAKRRLVDSAEWALFFASVALPIVITAACMVMLVASPLRPSLVTRIAVITAIMLGGPIALVWLLRRSARRRLRLELRLRMCPACHNRLRRQGGMLQCDQCHGSWKWPKRRDASYSVDMATAPTIDLSGTPDELLRRVIRHFSAETGTMHLHDGGMLTLRSIEGDFPPQVMDAIRSIPVGKGMAGLAAERREPVTACNIQTDASGNVRPGAKATGMEGAIVVPMIDSRGHLRGTLGVANRASRDWSEDERTQLLEIGRGIADRL